MRVLRLFVLLWLFAAASGCMFASSEGRRAADSEEEEASKPERLEAEVQRIIMDYEGMAESRYVDWAWMEPGRRFSRYETAAVMPVKNLSRVTESYIVEGVSTGLRESLNAVGLEHLDRGKLLLEAAIVGVNPEKPGGLDKINPFKDEEGLFLELELLLRDGSNGEIICKIRHRVDFLEFEEAVARFSDDLAMYMRSHW
jgi:hypothetical protein